ncbi:CU044_5270 family protein [Streptomyces sp. NPDC026673]|uniref:CU044_5270 family protein n=1 Tax=Streptomyces sp. NPDC026673 TaxID=3155724 RepID=UPI0033FA6BF5
MNELHEPGEAHDLAALREWDAGATPLTDQARHRARTRLFTVMNSAPATRPASPALGRRPLLRFAVTATAAAAAGAVTLVAVREEKPERKDPPRMRAVSAATVLNGAAARERRNERGRVVAPRDDQFIYTREIIKETEQGTGRVKTYVDEIWRSVDGSRPSWIMELGKGWWSDPDKDAAILDDPHVESVSTWPPQDWTVLKKLPTDPEKLIAAVRSRYAHHRKSMDGITPIEWSNIEFALAGLLKLVPIMPVGLRPAAFEALSLIPGVRAVPGRKDAKGRTGVAIVFDDPTGFHAGFGSNFVFDAETYEFLGYRDVRTSGSRTFVQFSYLDRWAITDRAKQRP